MKVQVRKAKEDEANQLTAIAIASKKYWNYPDSWYELWGDIFVISPKFIRDHSVWVATADVRIVGFIGISLNGKFAELEHLWVLPEFVKKTVGKTLFERVTKFCNENGIQTLRIESDPNATAFYEKMGARQIGFVESKPKPRKLPVLELKF